MHMKIYNVFLNTNYQHVSGKCQEEETNRYGKGCYAFVIQPWISSEFRNILFARLNEFVHTIFNILDCQDLHVCSKKYDLSDFSSSVQALHP